MYTLYMHAVFFIAQNAYINILFWVTWLIVVHSAQVSSNF